VRKSIPHIFKIDLACLAIALLFASSCSYANTSNYTSTESQSGISQSNESESSEQPKKAPAEEIVFINKDNFKKLVYQSDVKKEDKVPACILFVDDKDCDSQAAREHLQTWSKQFAGKVKFFWMSTTVSPKISATFTVKKTPTFCFLDLQDHNVLLAENSMDEASFAKYIQAGLTNTYTNKPYEKVRWGFFVHFSVFKYS
jgi:hypothetical protein